MQESKVHIEPKKKKKKKSTSSIYSQYNANVAADQAKHQAIAQQNLYGGRSASGSIQEEIEGDLKKHKKKLFKISFVDKGVKKRGTAVSHKGVMRIIHGKVHYKVYDEHNKDVTSQFKVAMKHDKK
jgi:hypothetical protein